MYYAINESYPLPLTNCVILNDIPSVSAIALTHFDCGFKEYTCLDDIEVGKGSQFQKLKPLTL